ncbi:MAG: hypothetical protein ACYC61_18000 [Isosphaeraceae bacterium]
MRVRIGRLLVGSLAVPIRGFGMLSGVFIRADLVLVGWREVTMRVGRVARWGYSDGDRFRVIAVAGSREVVSLVRFSSRVIGAVFVLVPSGTSTVDRMRPRAERVGSTPVFSVAAPASRP